MGNKKVKKEEAYEGPVQLTVKDEDGTKRRVWTITSNEDSVGNYIAEGLLAEEDRYRELTKLYKGQLNSTWRQHVWYRDKIEAHFAAVVYRDVWQDLYMEYNS